LIGPRLTIAITASLHSLFATFIVGALLIGAISESVGALTKEERYERLAHSIARTVVLISASVSFIGVALVLFLTTLWPNFWTTLFRIMFWPLIFEASLFFAEAVCLYTWYYSWGRWRHRVHLFVAWFGVGFAVTAMVMIDIVASYLLTPRPPLDTVRKIINPTMVQLTLHRFAGNLSWAGFALAALAAIRYLRSGGPKARACQEWAGAFCLVFGFGFLMLMPVIGFSYLKAVRAASEGAFNLLMLGAKSWIFVLQVFLLDLLFWTGSWYMFRMAAFHFKENRLFTRYYRPIVIGTMLAAGLIFVMPYQTRYIPFAEYLTRSETNWLGKMQPHKYIAMGVLIALGILNYGFYLGAFRFKKVWGGGGAFPQLLLILLGAFAILSMLNMGYARESARSPYLIYGKMTIEDETEAGKGSAPFPGQSAPPDGNDEKRNGRSNPDR